MTSVAFFVNHLWGLMMLSTKYQRPGPSGYTQGYNVNDPGRGPLCETIYQILKALDK